MLEFVKQLIRYVLIQYTPKFSGCSCFCCFVLLLYCSLFLVSGSSFYWNTRSDSFTLCSTLIFVYLFVYTPLHLIQEKIKITSLGFCINPTPQINFVNKNIIIYDFRI